MTSIQTPMDTFNQRVTSAAAEERFFFFFLARVGWPLRKSLSVHFSLGMNKGIDD